MGECLTIGYCLRTIGFPIVFWKFCEEDKALMEGGQSRDGGIPH